MRYVEFHDLLLEPILINGIPLDAHISCIVGDHVGTLEVDSIEIGDVYLKPFGHDLVKLDQDSLKTRNRQLYNLFAKECERIAIERAKSVLPSQWQDDEDFDFAG